MIDFLMQTNLGQSFSTFILSMVPVIELRGAIPFGMALGLNPIFLYFLCVIGNMIPVPFIILFSRKIIHWLGTHHEKLKEFGENLERKAHLKGRKALKYRNLGLCLLVAIPLPGTGAWTGALVAAVLDIRIKNALLAILLGVILAGIIVLSLS